MRKIWLYIFLFFFMKASILVAKPGAFGETLCQNASYRCFKVNPGDTWESLWPQDAQRDRIRRLNRINIKLKAGMLLALPDDLESLDILTISPFPLKIEATNEKKLIVNLSQLAWAAYDEDGTLLRWGPASGGKDFCPDVGYPCRTPSGEFSARSKKGVTCKSSRFPIRRGGAPMPYCIFFKRGYALHGSPEVPGYNASHGCVRLFKEDAQWLNEDFVELPDREKNGTSIIILP